MTQKILLTGRPGCGKTTLIRRVVNDLGLAAGGFYTQEIRKRGQRVGFKIITFEGKEAVFADVNFKTSERVGKYGLDLSALDLVGVEAIRKATDARQLVVIDEIGPMEIRSATFRAAVTEALDSPETLGILATIVARSLPFTDAIKKRSDVCLVEVRSETRKQLVAEISDRFETTRESHHGIRRLRSD